VKINREKMHVHDAELLPMMENAV